MLLLDPQDAEEIGQAITKEEQRTSGEIVAVLAAQSGSYRLLPLFLSAFIALLVPLFLLYLPQLSEGRYLVWAEDRIYFIQLVIFVVLSFLLSMRPLRYWIVPRSLKNKWAHAHALEQFAAQEMHTTSGRTGVMIFVSVIEHYAEVIADKAIYEKVPPEVWSDVVNELVSHIGQKEPKKGFLMAINRAGDLLSEHFPPGSINHDELSNHLIIIE
jgi:putative membrane protein